MGCAHTKVQADQELLVKEIQKLHTSSLTKLKSPSSESVNSTLLKEEIMKIRL
jgi:hypothetical protein